MSHRQLHGEIHAACLDESDAASPGEKVRLCGHLHVYEPRRQRRHLGSRRYTCFHRLQSPGNEGAPRPRVLYAHDSGGKKETESQREENSPESSGGSSRVTGCNMRCFLVGGEGGYPQVLCPLPEIPQRLRKSVPSAERVQIQLLSKKIKIYIFSLLFIKYPPSVALLFVTIRILLPRGGSSAPSVYLRGIPTPCMGHFLSAKGVEGGEREHGDG